MNTDNWKPFYKINPDNNSLIETNLIYTPLISPSGNTFCMSFDHTSKYQNEDLASWLPHRPYYTKEMVKFFFDREVKYLTEFQHRSWAPKNIDISVSDQKIFFNWSGETCNQIIYSKRKLTDYCPNWQEQMYNIIKDIDMSGYYKTSLYPHCYFIDNGILRTFDFYGCADRTYPFVELKNIKGMIGETSESRFTSATINDQLNIEILFKEALNQYIKWPGDPLPNFYKRLFNE
jgi:hypothetical protein